jgi:hypothetical protein
MDWMLTSGRWQGGKPGTGLSGRSARLTLGRLSAALEAAVREGKFVRNVANLVSPPEHIKREHETWSRGQEVPGQGILRPAVCRMASVALWPAPR